MMSDGKILKPAQPGDKIFWSSNSWGFRGTEFSREKPKGIIRIVCLGASTTEGSQSDTETYPYYLQQEITKALPEKKFEVINAGHHAFGIRDLLELLKQRVFPLNPDIILFYEASNNIAFHEFVRLPRSCQIGECWPATYGETYRWFYDHSAMFVMLTNRLGMNDRIPPQKAHWFDVSRPKKSEIAYREGLAEIVRETKKRNIAIVLSSFVTLANPNLRVSHAANPLVFDDLYKIWYPVTAGEISQIYDRFNRQSKEVAEEYGIPYADVAADFPKHLRYFPFDLIHLSPAGNRLLARKFATFLSQKVLPGMLSQNPS
jgi:lysophospholipase L1-like esterase